MDFKVSQQECDEYKNLRADKCVCLCISVNLAKHTGFLFYRQLFSFDS